MVMVNQVTREITGKIVYYGPGLCGKTTNLHYIYGRLDKEQRGKMLSLSTYTDRTIYFDFLPMDLGTIRGFKIRIQLYTVPGQVFYEATRKRVLKGADGVVFVADSQKNLREANLHIRREMDSHLRENGLDPDTIPMIHQYNKRDLDPILSIEELEGDLNRGKVPFFESVATVGSGVEETLKAISKLVLKRMMTLKPARSILQPIPGQRDGKPAPPATEETQDLPARPDTAGKGPTVRRSAEVSGTTQVIKQIPEDPSDQFVLFLGKGKTIHLTVDVEGRRYSVSLRVDEELR